MVALLLQCPNCPKRYIKKNSLYKHVKFDCGNVKSWYCTYPDCNYTTNRKENLKKHLESSVHRTMRETFMCNNCPRTYKNIGTLRRHMKYECRFFCPKCGKLYLKKKSLNEHIRLNCRKNPTKQCAFCTYACFDNFSLVRHLKKKHVPKPSL
ncbi:zinc finger protein 449-like [Anthonomus grandis grandis]|uniref:zinc finger protein 449-like n=1 Tax=Anthonomus grandis grandis TaxID=2921223 RepID=UPI002164FBC2|nr:zinc finger protein 449-like [Anthonomus grandis grandis]